MKITHRVPIYALRPEPISRDYQAEVDRSTNKAQVAYERAQRKLAAAERRRERADAAVLAAAARRRTASDSLKREARVAAELVELRREELRVIEALMRTPPAGGVQHRGRGSHRHVASPGSQI